MGKQRGNQRGKAKSMFKVAGAKSFKTKNKAKPVSIQLKKLTQEVKKKTEDVNKLMDELQTEVRTEPKPKTTVNKTNQNKMSTETIEKAKEALKNSEDVLNKINDMEV